MLWSCAVELGFPVHIKDVKYFFCDIFTEKKSIFLKTELPGKMNFYTEKKEKLKNTN